MAILGEAVGDAIGEAIMNAVGPGCHGVGGDAVSEAMDTAVRAIRIGLYICLCIYIFGH